MRRRTKLLLLFVFFIAVGVFLVRLAGRETRIPENAYLVLDVGGEYIEAPPQDLIGRFLARGGKTLVDLLLVVRTAKADPRIRGMIVRIGSLDAGWAKVLDIRDALADFRQSGKPMLALLEQEVGASNSEYYLATAADRIYLPPSATAPLAGLAGHFLFLGGVWEKIDVEMTVEKIAEYKTFGDMIANKEMTPAHREMAESLLDSINDHFVGTIAQARNLDTDKIRAVIDECPTSAQELIDAGLADGAKYLEDLHEELGGEQAPLVPMGDYAGVRPESHKLGIGPKIAVVYAVGGIVPGESGSSVQGRMLGARTLGNALREAAEDEDIQAIVLRVDSPGGSALASDLVWRATQAAKKIKPVIVSMSDVAGSGGYYIAAGATRIVAQPTTLTGSIGVIFARPGIDRLLGNLGITTETITRGRFAGLDAPTTPMTPEGRAKLIAEMQNIYDVFVHRVAVGRALSTEQVDSIGRGRVWTGTQAKEKGLVDEIGGFQVALEAAKRAAGIDVAQEVKLIFYPRQQSMLERLSSALEAHAATTLPAPLGDVVVRLGWLGEGGVLTHMPQLIEIR